MSEFTNPVSLIEAAKANPHGLLTHSTNIHYPSHGAGVLSAIEENHFWFIARRQMVEAIPKSSFGDSTARLKGVDVGCGSGFNSVWLTNKGWRTIGVDAFPGFLHFQQTHQGAGFVQADINQIDPKPEFDFVLLLDVIEHIEDDEAFFAKCVRLLKPGGLIIVTVPAFSWLWSSFDELSGHQRRYNSKDIRRLLATANTIAPAQLAYKSYFFASTLPLYFLSRLLNRSKELKVETMELTPPSLINAALRHLLSIELHLSQVCSLPIGSSLVFALRLAQFPADAS